MNFNLKISAWAAIILAIITFLDTFAITWLLPISFMPIKAWLVLVLILVILIGFIIISTKIKLNFLKIISYIAFIYMVLSTVLASVSKSIPLEGPTLAAIIGFIQAIIFLVFGIAVLKLKENYGNIGNGTGILFIVWSALMIISLPLFYMKVPFYGAMMMLTNLVYFVTIILSSILFFKASK
jgi:hypothetical protein|tara:strand:- start:156 stop:701 length:546 start_codon:yes stop_codon:yes gene_type:complete